MKIPIKTLRKGGDARGRHYYDCGPVSLIDLLYNALTPEEFCGFLKANAIKYVFRHDRKKEPLGDLAKAEQYIAWLIELATAPKTVTSWKTARRRAGLEERTK